MAKVLITTHTGDEHGWHVPGDIIELADEEARNYHEKQWGIIQPEEKAEKVARAVIETPEDHAVEHETADLKRKKK